MSEERDLFKSHAYLSYQEIGKCYKLNSTLTPILYDILPYQSCSCNINNFDIVISPLGHYVHNINWQESLPYYWILKIAINLLMLNLLLDGYWSQNHVMVIL